MLNEQGKRIDWHSENFNKEREKKKNRAKECNNWSEKYIRGN